MDNRRAVLVVAGLTILAAALRLIGLDGGLWYDEIVTLVEFVRLPVRDLLTTFPADNNNHPLYSLLAHVTTTTLGERPWTLRLPAVVFGVATIPVLYVFGRTVTSRREALLACALLTVSYHHIWFSQNARAYSALAFWTVLTPFILWQGLHTGRRSLYICYGVAAALSLYTHLTMALVIATHLAVCILIWMRPGAEGLALRSVRGPLLAFGLAGAISLALYAPLLPDIMQQSAATRPASVARIANPHWAIAEVLRGFRDGWSGPGLVGAAAIMGLGLLSYLHRSRLLTALFLVPVLLMAAAPVLFGWPTRPRFFFFAIGFGALTAIRGTSEAGALLGRLWRADQRQASRSNLIANLIAGVLILGSAASLRGAYRLPKQDYEGAMRFVESRATADAIATVGVTTLPYQRYYRRPWTAFVTLEDLERFRSGNRRVWILYTLPAYLNNELRTMIVRDCTPVAIYRGTVGDGDITVCSIDPPASGRR